MFPFFLIPTNTGARLCDNNKGTLFRCVPLLGRTFLLGGRKPIEWKYTECYGTKDLSRDGRKGEVRLGRYSALIDASPQLKSMDNYRGSIYYQEPFYQLMRQTLWAENIIRHRDEEILKADDYLHIHVIPTANGDLLNKQYHVSNATMKATWRNMLTDQSKYVIIDPMGLFEPIVDSYPELSQYLEKRYW